MFCFSKYHAHVVVWEVAVRRDVDKGSDLDQGCTGQVSRECTVLSVVRKLFALPTCTRSATDERPPARPPTRMSPKHPPAKLEPTENIAAGSQLPSVDSTLGFKPVPDVYSTKVLNLICRF